MPFFRLQHAGGRSQWQLVKYLKFWQSPNYSTSSRVSIPRTISREIHGANGKMWGIFVLASDSSRTLDSPKANKMGRVKRKPPGNGEPFILVGIGISSVPFFWELAPRFVDLVFYSKAGGGGWFWFQADVVTPSSSVAGAHFFCSVGCCELEERQQKGLKRSHAFGGKKNLPQTQKGFLMDIRCKTNKISRWILGLCASKSDCSHNKRFDKNSWDACCRSWDILQIVMHSFCSKKT